MLLILDKNLMELQVRCGILENYKPNKEIKDLNDKTKELRAKMDKFMEEIVKPELKEIEEKVEEINGRYIEKD